MMDVYQSPFNTRYSSPEMSYLFSEDFKFKTWRRLWIALAEAEKELGLNITDEQINELKEYKDTLNIKEARAREEVVRHDVMSHIYAYGLQAKKAKPIIHLGATSCYVGDNTDIIIINEALNIIARKVAAVIDRLKAFALKYKALPTLGFTHFQAAQLTTVGKRASLWIQDLLMDLTEIERIRENIKLLGSKGTTGTQASFMELFENDEQKCKRLDELITKKLGFNAFYPVSGQTYPRKFDSLVINTLGGIAQSAHKFANDIRLLQHLKEVEEPFEKEQIGSSAMAYKRNPMRSERITGLSRFVLSLVSSPAMTASEQWLERTLDDSSNKRVAMSEAFLATDAVLELYLNVTSGLVVYPKMIEKHILEELPFMATENVIMHAVKSGGDRQELHEAIRRHSMEAGKRIKEGGLVNDLVERIALDPIFGMTKMEILSVMKPGNYIGRAPGQVDDFVREFVEPALEKYKGQMVKDTHIKV
ncbi:MAG: adenylosuccinate lyase [Clostridiales bacterium]|jgi:adenylosuccinate lyase|nr:adenylosuccinate lyase [Clostridiales bacterium]